MLDSTDTHIMSNVKKREDFKETVRFNDNVYKTFITGLLMKLQSKDDYSNMEIIEDQQFQKILKIILGTNYKQNKHLMDVFEKIQTSF